MKKRFLLTCMCGAAKRQCWECHVYAGDEHPPIPREMHQFCGPCRNQKSERVVHDTARAG